MTEVRDFRPDWVSAPGDTIRDILQEQNISLVEFAGRLDLSVPLTENLVEGRVPLTLQIARQLTSVCGASVEFWMRRDFEYQEGLAQQEASSREWLREFPVKEMIQFGWLHAPSPGEELEASLRFFEVPDPRAWHHRYDSMRELVAFRTSPSVRSSTPVVTAWLRRGDILAQQLPCEAWAPAAFRTLLPDVRLLTRLKDPQTFFPRLQALCAKTGVAVVGVRAPRGCPASAATRFVSPQKAILQLSFRYLTDDQFWFSFFHEAGHLLLHGLKGFFLEGTDAPASEQEREADAFAQVTLIPDESAVSRLSRRPSAVDVIKLARELGIAPGIVVGQLQHRGHVPYSHLNGLKRHYKWDRVHVINERA